MFLPYTKPTHGELHPLIRLTQARWTQGWSDEAWDRSKFSRVPNTREHTHCRRWTFVFWETSWFDSLRPMLQTLMHLFLLPLEPWNDPSSWQKKLPEKLPRGKKMSKKWLRNHLLKRQQLGHLARSFSLLPQRNCKMLTPSMQLLQRCNLTAAAFIWMLFDVLQRVRFLQNAFDASALVVHFE